VGERNRSWLDEKRVHVARSRIPASPPTEQTHSPHRLRIMSPDTGPMVENRVVGRVRGAAVGWEARNLYQS
jgi:hypothetical protein